MRVKHYTDLLNDNFEDQPTTQFLPCIRNTIKSQCDPAIEPNCWDRCCPSGYSCDRSPVVGLHCFDLSNPCGDPEWCEFYADISGQCRNDVCQLDKMVERMVVWAFILSGIGVLFDVIDMVTENVFWSFENDFLLRFGRFWHDFCKNQYQVMFFAAQDAVTVKAVNNLASCCVKCLAFSVEENDLKSKWLIYSLQAPITKCFRLFLEPAVCHSSRH